MIGEKLFYFTLCSKLMGHISEQEITSLSYRTNSLIKLIMANKVSAYMAYPMMMNDVGRKKVVYTAGKRVVAKNTGCHFKFSDLSYMTLIFPCEKGDHLMNCFNIVLLELL